MVTDFAVYLVFVVQDLWYYFLVCIISSSLLTWQMATTSLFCVATKEIYVLWPTTILVYSTVIEFPKQTSRDIGVIGLLHGHCQHQKRKPHPERRKRRRVRHGGQHKAHDKNDRKHQPTLTRAVFFRDDRALDLALFGGCDFDHCE